MEKAPRSKGTIVLKYLQKAATFTISSNPHSPRRVSFGPFASIIPSEARQKKRNDEAFNEEPSSPKVTCIGQIKHKKERKKEKKNNFLKKKKEIKKKKEEKEEEEKREEVLLAPSLGQFKRFASGREAFKDFDWEKEKGFECEEEKEEIFNVYHSAPLVFSGDVTAAEHKEIGLWRRRSLAALMPLQVKK